MVRPRRAGSSRPVVWLSCSCSSVARARPPGRDGARGAARNHQSPDGPGHRTPEMQSKCRAGSETSLRGRRSPPGVRWRRRPRGLERREVRRAVKAANRSATRERTAKGPRKKDCPFLAADASGRGRRWTIPYRGRIQPVCSLLAPCDGRARHEYDAPERELILARTLRSGRRASP